MDALVEVVGDPYYYYTGTVCQQGRHTLVDRTAWVIEGRCSHPSRRADLTHFWTEYEHSSEEFGRLLRAQNEDPALVQEITAWLEENPDAIVSNWHRGSPSEYIYAVPFLREEGITRLWNEIFGSLRGVLNAAEESLMIKVITELYPEIRATYGEDSHCPFCGGSLVRPWVNDGCQEKYAKVGEVRWRPGQGLEAYQEAIRKAYQLPKRMLGKFSVTVFGVEVEVEEAAPDADIAQHWLNEARRLAEEIGPLFPAGWSDNDQGVVDDFEDDPYDHAGTGWIEDHILETLIRWAS